MREEGVKIRPRSQQPGDGLTKSRAVREVPGKAVGGASAVQRPHFYTGTGMMMMVIMTSRTVSVIGRMFHTGKCASALIAGSTPVRAMIT